MPKYYEIPDSKGGKYIILSTYGDIIELIPPHMWFVSYLTLRNQTILGYPEEKAKERANIELVKWSSVPCPDFLLSLYYSQGKKEQEHLLKGKSITVENLLCWFLKGDTLNGLFSQYTYEAGIPNELVGRTPVIIDANNPSQIKSVGKTDLSNAALLHLVNNQNKLIAQLIDLPDGHWFCFYRTHRGLTGRESGNHGEHIHFISSAYGVNRNEMIENFKKGICPSNGFHVHFVDYHEENMKKD